MNNNELKMNIDEYLPLRDVVFQTLRKAIITGSLSPGERLMEISLAKQLGVSRTPVREAIRKLELEGLVVMIPRKGARVAGITEGSLQDVMEIRSALEEFAVVLACRRIDEEGKGAMIRAHQDFKEAVDNHADMQELIEKDEEFHDSIFYATKNTRLINLINSLREQFYRYRMAYVKGTDMREHLVTEHEALMNAIFHQDEEMAKSVMNSHIINQKDAILHDICQDQSIPG